MIKKEVFSRGDIKRNLRLPKSYTTDLAEFMGILTGDGYMNHYRKYDYNIDITGNKLSDSEFIEKHVFTLAKKLFNVRGCIIRRNDQNTIYIRIRSRAIFYYLKKIGFRTGYKRRISIPVWIQKDKKFMIYFVRGLFDTDGCLSLKNRNGKIYPVVSISSKSDLLLKKVQGFIKTNGIPSCLTKNTSTNPRYKKPIIGFKLEVNGFKNCSDWILLIKSNNKRNLSKFKKASIKWEEGDLNSVV